jgi:phosphonate transport system substrate-binding protein
MEAKTLRLIYIYSQKDKKMRDELSTFMDSYPHLQEWHEDNILAGVERLEEIKKNMASADIILLLLSADFLKDSKDIWRLALDLHQSNGTRLIPVHLSRFIPYPEFEDLLALPRNGIPINKWESPDEAYAEIAQEVDKVVQEIHAPPSPIKTATNGSNGTNAQTTPLSIGTIEPLSPTQQTSSGTMSRKKFLTIIGSSVGITGITAAGFTYLIMSNEINNLKSLNELKASNGLKIGSELKTLKDTQATIEGKTLKDIRIIFTHSSISSDLDPAPLINALQQKSGLPVSLKFDLKSYGESITRFGSGEFNVFWGSDYAYVIAAARYRVRPILQRKGQTQDGLHYYSHILTKRSSNIHSVAELKGQSLSFVDQYSTSGYLYPRYELQKNGLDEKQVHTVYVGTHKESLESVISGRTDAGAVSSDYYKSTDNSFISKAYTDTLGKYNVKDEDILSIYRSDPLPTPPIVVHADTLDSDVRKLQSAFLLLDDPTLLRSLGISGFGSVTDATYDSVRNVARELGIDLSTV